MSNLIQYIIQDDPEEELKKKQSQTLLSRELSSRQDTDKNYKFNSRHLLENDFSHLQSKPVPTARSYLSQALAKNVAKEGNKVSSALSPKPIGNDAASYKIAQNTKGNINTNLSYKLGTLSGLSESGHDPAAIGKDNAGGPSYGAYQIATYTGTMNKYLNFIKNNPQYKEFYDALEKSGGNKAATSLDPNFVKVWKELSQNDNFNNSQYNFIVNTHLQPLLNSVRNKEFLDIDNRHPVVKDALYSMSVQHRKAAQIVNNTLQELQNNNIKIGDATLLKALYKKRADYVNSLSVSQHPGDGKITQNEKDNIVNKRYPNELKEALKYLGQ